MNQNTSPRHKSKRSIVCWTLLVIFTALITGGIISVWEARVQETLEAQNTEWEQRIADLNAQKLQLENRVDELLKLNSVNSIEEYAIKKDLLNQKVEISIGSYEKVPLEFELFGTLEYSDDVIKRHAQTRYENTYGLHITDLRDITYTTTPLTGQWSTGEPKQGIKVSALYYNGKEEAVDSSTLNIMIPDETKKQLTVTDINNLESLKAALVSYSKIQCANINLKLDETTLSKYPQELRLRIMCMK